VKLTASDPDGSVPDHRLAQAGLASEHHQSALGSRSPGRLAACQLVCVVGTHGEHTASGEHSGEGKEAGLHGKRGELTPVLYHRIGSCLALPLVFHRDIQRRGSGCLRFRCNLTNDCAKVPHEELGAADLALPDCGVDCAHAHSLQT